MKTNKNKRRRRTFWFLIGMVCFLASAVMAGMAGRVLLSYRRGESGLDQLYEDVGRLAEEETSAVVSGGPQGADGEPQGAAGEPQGADGGTQSSGSETAAAGQGSAERRPRPSLEKLKELNSDTVGWVRIPGTVIDYPVMQTPEEPDFYFHRDFYKNNSSYGMIYLDGACRLDGSSPNLLLYGHHMRNGTMFASIEKYASESYWKKHPEIYLDVTGTEEVYEVVAAMRISADGLTQEFMEMLAAGTEEQYGELIAYAKQASPYQTGITAEWPEQLLTLTTCEYSQKDGRFLLITRKKPVS